MKNEIVGKTVQIDIKVKCAYTSDLYQSIQGKKGIVVKKYPDDVLQLPNENKYLVQFDEATTKAYKRLSGNWSSDDRKKMEFYTERKDFKLTN